MNERLANAGRWVATVVIVGLIGLAIGIPGTSIGRRGTDPAPQALVPEVAALVGKPLPSLSFLDLDGRIVRSEDLLGHALLLIFERSVDW